MIHVLLVDSQALVLGGIKTILSQELDFDIVGMATHSEAAIAQAQALNPDVMLIDAQMLDAKGDRLAPLLCQQFPNIKILVLSADERDGCIMEAIRAGAKGYLLKSMLSEELPAVIRLVQRGHTLLAPNVLEKVHFKFLHRKRSSEKIHLQLRGLSSRQQEIFHLVGTGATNREIAGQLHIAEGTVKSYITNLLNYFNFKNRVQLAIYANAISKDKG